MVRVYGVAVVAVAVGTTLRIIKAVIVSIRPSCVLVLILFT
jgi:hypothetical protein